MSTRLHTDMLESRIALRIQLRARKQLIAAEKAALDARIDDLNEHPRKLAMLLKDRRKQQALVARQEKHGRRIRAKAQRREQRQGRETVAA